MQYTQLQNEVYSQINQETLYKIVDHLGQDESILTDPIFQRDIQRNYTSIKRQLYTNDFWNFTRVHNYKLQIIINPITGQKTIIRPPDFLKLIQGFDKQSNLATIIYSTSLINNKTMLGIKYINYIRYVSDNDNKVKIPDYFQDYLACKVAHHFSSLQTWQVTTTQINTIEKGVSYFRRIAKSQDKDIAPFETGIDYNNIVV